MEAAAFLPIALGALLAPLLPGIANRVKAWTAGRRGPPVAQLYFDLAKLARKGSVYSTTASWLFRAAPTLALAAVVSALALVPLGPARAPLAFEGDIVLLAALLALHRFFTGAAALDTGSSFEGMGVSRELFFGALAEPALIAGLLVAARGASSASLSTALAPLAEGGALAPPLLLVVAALFLVALAENARLPVDDPATHLELTMVHEAMILDHSGPGLAYAQYAAALKLWIFAALLGDVVVLMLGLGGVAGFGAALGLTFAVAAGVGAVESSTARLRLALVPRYLAGACALAAVAALLAVF